MQSTFVDPANITPSDVQSYYEQGYMRFGRVLNDEELAQARAHIDWLIANLSADDWPERMNMSHLNDEKMFALCTHKGILDAVEKLIGPNIVLFASHLLAKPAKLGHEVPWHQDGIFWPLEPMKVLTVWLALDNATKENGCMRVIPGTQDLGPLPHEDKDTTQSVLHLGMSEDLFDPAKAVDIELKMGEFSIHEPYIIHGSNMNRSEFRRAGYTMRFMPASTKMSREGWYKEHKLFLVRGVDVEGINSYENV